MMSAIDSCSSAGLRSISAFSGIAARSSARTLFSEPLAARPMGVRIASTITASGIRSQSPWVRLEEDYMCQRSGARRGPLARWVIDAALVRSRASARKLAPALSADAVIAPERDQITAKVLAERYDLSLEAPPQLEHKRLVGRRRLSVGHAPAQAPHRPGPGQGGYQRIYRFQRTPRSRRAATHHRHREPPLHQPQRAHTF